MLRRRDFLMSAGALAAAKWARGAEKKPSLLLMVANGWRAQAMPFGDSDVQAPNLQRLAREGIEFDRVYSSYPAENPSRAALITGCFPFTVGVTGSATRLPADQPTLATELKNAGYKTAFIGSWTLDGTNGGTGARQHGFEFWADGGDAGASTGRAIDFIKQNQANPFFLLLAWPPRPRGSIKIRGAGPMGLRSNVPEDDQAQAQTEYAAYYGYCSALDDQVGRLLGALEEQRGSGNTVVVFTSDRGDMLRSHGFEDDDMPFEEAVRVPLILRDPRLKPAGGRNDFPVSNVDLMPTLLGLCGAAMPKAVQGRDLSMLIAAGQGERPESVYSTGQRGLGGEWRMVVRGLDKLVVDRQLRVTHLYNLAQDPFELENRAEEPSQELKRDELSALLADWMRRSGDGMDPSGLKRRG